MRTRVQINGGILSKVHSPQNFRFLKWVNLFTYTILTETRSMLHFGKKIPWGECIFKTRRNVQYLKLVSTYLLALQWSKSFPWLLMSASITMLSCFHEDMSWMHRSGERIRVGQNTVLRLNVDILFLLSLLDTLEGKIG